MYLFEWTGRNLPLNANDNEYDEILLAALHEKNLSYVNSMNNHSENGVKNDQYALMALDDDHQHAHDRPGNEAERR